MKKILVTGATGFLGSNLIQALIKKEEGQIVGMKRANSPMKLVESFRDQVEWIEGDVLDISSLDTAFNGVDEVYHTAAVISYHPALKAKMQQVNVEGTANVVDACLEKKVKKLLHVSSIAAIGREIGQDVTSEKNKWSISNATSEYGKTKHEAELEIFRGIAEGLHANIINPSMIIGPGYWENGTCRFFPRVYQGQKLYPVGGTGFVDVKDVAELCIRLMHKDDSGKRVIANAVNLSFHDFFQLLAEKLGVNGPTIKVNNFAANFAWRFEAVRSKLFNVVPFLTQETAAASMKSSKFDNSLSLNYLDMDYRSIDHTIQRTAEVFLSTQTK